MCFVGTPKRMRCLPLVCRRKGIKPLQEDELEKFYDEKIDDENEVLSDSGDEMEKKEDDSKVSIEDEYSDDYDDDDDEVQNSMKNKAEVK